MNIMTVLIIIITLILVGMFWRQIIKGGLISLIILLFLSLIAYFFLSNSAYAKQDLNNFSSTCRVYVDKEINTHDSQSNKR